MDKTEQICDKSKVSLQLYLYISVASASAKMGLKSNPTVILLGQLSSLLFGIAYHSLAALLSLPFWALKLFLAGRKPTTQSATAKDQDVAFYEGIVTHIRRQPKENSFQ